jgi:hypothetical protein
MRQSSMPANVARADRNDLPKVGALGEAEHALQMEIRLILD